MAAPVLSESAGTNHATHEYARARAPSHREHRDRVHSNAIVIALHASTQQMPLSLRCMLPRKGKENQRAVAAVFGAPWLSESCTWTSAKY